jgi:hypothetical protein
MNPSIHTELMKTQVANLHRQAESDHMAHAAWQSARTEAPRRHPARQWERRGCTPSQAS